MITRMDSNRVHSTNTNPSRLIIGAPFTNSDAGVYTCANADTLSSASVSDMITLRAGNDPGGVVTCTITSTNIPDLTDAGGPILIGTKNVIIYCICRRSNNVAVGPTLWSHDGSDVPTTNSNPFYRNNVPAPLIFASFAATHAGTYQCAREGAGQNDVADTITLTAQACVIRPNVDTLTLRNPLGRIVEFHCQCVNSDGTETEAMWWFQDGNSATSAPTQTFSNLANPALYIPNPFDNSKDGTYICSPGMANDPTRDTVTLDLGTDDPGMATICNIVSTNLPTVTAAGGPIISGTTNVILYCICNRSVVAGQTRWFFNGTRITLTLDDGSGNPYSRDNVPSPLIIPFFVAPHNGMYSCGPSNNFAEVTGIITLTLLVLVDPPSNVTATVITPRSITVTWIPSPSPNVTGYLISYTTDAPYISMNDRSQSIPVGNTTTGTINNVEEATTYTITVQSNSSDGLSPKSNVETVTTQPIAPSSPPQNVMVTGVPRASLNVSWQPPPPIDHNGAITGYIIQYTRVGSSDPMTMNVSSVTRQVTIPSLTAFVNYSVTVATVNSAGTGRFSDAMVVRSGQDVPTAPRSLMAVGSTDTSVTLSWMPPDPPNGLITRYSVMYRRLDGGSFTTVNTMATDLTYTVTELMTATEYRFRVTASTVVGEGARSNAVDVFVGLLAPTNVRATMLTPRSVEVTWIPSLSPGVTGYLISYTTDASYISMNNRSRSMAVGNTTVGTLIDLEEGTTYTIIVQATAGNDMSSNSNAEMVTTETIAPSSPPQNVMVATFDPASLMVSWLPPPPIDHNGPITGYVIQYTRVESSDMMSVTVTDGTTYTISGLPVSTEYLVSVAAMNVKGTGPFSNPLVNRSGEDRPSAPQSLNITSVNSTSVMLQWKLPATPNGRIILYSLKYNSTTLIVTNTSSDVLMYTVGGLSSENVYIFQVTAHTRVGEGPPINITVVIPPRPISNVTIPNESISSSTLTLTWMGISLVNSVLLRYTVFYLPVIGPYDLIMASNRGKIKSAQAEELTMDFTGTTGILLGLNGSVTYMIQVAAVVMLNGQVVTGDRSTIMDITTQEGVPTFPRNLKVMILINSDVTLTWNRPDPPNGLITQYSVSYVNTNTQDSNITIIIPVDNGGDSILSLTWTNLTQGTHNFIVVASTAVGLGESANLIQHITFGTNCDDSSDDNCGVNIALATLLAIALIGLVVSVVIIVLLIIQRKQSRYAVSQSNVRYSDVKQSGSTDYAITQSTNKHIKPSEPEYEAVDNMKPCSDVKMDANPAYQATT